MIGKLIDLVRSVGSALLPFHVATEDKSTILLRAGKCKKELEPGFYWKIPLVDLVMSCDARVHFYRTSEQSLMTKDGVPIVISALMSFRAYNAKKAILSSEKFGQSVWDGTAATLSKLVADRDFNYLSSDEFANEFASIVAEENKAFGIKVLTCRLENLAKARAYRIIR